MSRLERATVEKHGMAIDMQRTVVFVWVLAVAAGFTGGVLFEIVHGLFEPASVSRGLMFELVLLFLALFMGGLVATGLGAARYLRLRTEHAVSFWIHVPFYLSRGGHLKISDFDSNSDIVPQVRKPKAWDVAIGVTRWLASQHPGGSLAAINKDSKLYKSAGLAQQVTAARVGSFSPAIRRTVVDAVACMLVRDISKYLQNLTNPNYQYGRRPIAEETLQEGFGALLLSSNLYARANCHDLLRAKAPRFFRFKNTSPSKSKGSKHTHEVVGPDWLIRAGHAELSIVVSQEWRSQPKVRIGGSHSSVSVTELVPERHRVDIAVAAVPVRITVRYTGLKLLAIIWRARSAAFDYAVLEGLMSFIRAGCDLGYCLRD